MGECTEDTQKKPLILVEAGCWLHGTLSYYSLHFYIYLKFSILIHVLKNAHLPCFLAFVLVPTTSSHTQGDWIPFLFAHILPHGGGSLPLLTGWTDTLSSLCKSLSSSHSVAIAHLRGSHTNLNSSMQPCLCYDPHFLLSASECYSAIAIAFVTQVVFIKSLHHYWSSLTLTGFSSLNYISYCPSSSQQVNSWRANPIS